MFLLKILFEPQQQSIYLLSAVCCCQKHQLFDHHSRTAPAFCTFLPLPAARTSFIPSPPAARAPAFYHHHQHSTSFFPAIDKWKKSNLTVYKQTSIDPQSSIRQEFVVRIVLSVFLSLFLSLQLAKVPGPSLYITCTCW